MRFALMIEPQQAVAWDRAGPSRCPVTERRIATLAETSEHESVDWKPSGAPCGLRVHRSRPRPGFANRSTPVSTS